MNEDIYRLLIENGYLQPGEIDLSKRIAILLAILLTSIIIYFVLKKAVVPVIRKLVENTSITWDDHLLNLKVLNAACFLIPTIAADMFMPLAFRDHPLALIVVDKIFMVAIIALCVKLVNAFISSFYIISTDFDKMRNRPLKGFYQMLRIVVYCIGAILIISILIDKEPGVLLTGIGASAAVLMLIFKDTLMGLVAGVQINVYDTLRPGDWIIMDKHGANGEVTEVTLNLVRIKNWDNSIVTIPSYLFISESFQNWRNMRESKARRINEKIYLDINTIRICDKFEEETFRKIAGIRQPKEEEKRERTNLFYFRYFLENYLRRHPEVTPLPHLMVRQQPSTANGMPIEIYCFTIHTAWVDYEHFKAEIIEFAYASLNRFGLSAFQAPTGADIEKLAKH